MTGPIEIIFILAAILLVLSVIASKITDRFGIPALLLFLMIGMLAGSEGIGGIYFDDPKIAQAVGLFSLAIILFSGGLDSDWGVIKPVVAESLVLATLGVVITAGILGYAAHLVFGLSLSEGLLLGSVISSTDAAAVFSLLRGSRIRLQPRISGLLEFESGSNDPMAVFLTVGLIEWLLAPAGGIWPFLILFCKQMAIGAVAGVIVGWAALYMINRLRLGYEGLYPVLVLGLILLTYAGAALVQGSGFLAVYLVGLILGRADFLHKNSLIKFYDGLAWLSQIFMFLTLGLLVFPSRLLAVSLPALLLAGILMLVARPISVWISLLPFKFKKNEIAFVAWVGLRGAVPIVLATYPRIANLPNAELIFNVVFFVVLTSVVIQGTTLKKAVKLFHVADTSSEPVRYPLEVAGAQNWHGILKEISVCESSQADGKAIFELGLPDEYLVVLIARGKDFIIPNGSIRLQAGDKLLGLAEKKVHQKVTGLLQQCSQEEVNRS